MCPLFASLGPPCVLASQLCPLVACCGAGPRHHEVKFFLSIAQPSAFILLILAPQIRPLQARPMLLPANVFVVQPYKLRRTPCTVGKLPSNLNGEDVFLSSACQVVDQSQTLCSQIPANMKDKRLNVEMIAFRHASWTKDEVMWIHTSTMAADNFTKSRKVDLLLQVLRTNVCAMQLHIRK